MAEKNTWPFIPRIRAHCLVEKTLDKCVQRLRHRITQESDDNLLTLSDAAQQQRVKPQQAGDNANPSPRGSPLRSRDRTPSFYTSRSIVNLSGLSVADPTPMRRTQGSSAAISSAAANEAVRRKSNPPAGEEAAILPNRMRKSSLSNGTAPSVRTLMLFLFENISWVFSVWSLGRSSDERDALAKDSEEEDDEERNAIGEDAEVKKGGDDEDSSFWNLTVRANSMPLQGSVEEDLHPTSTARALSASSVLQSTDDLIKRMSSAENLAHEEEQQQQHEAGHHARRGDLRAMPPIKR